MPFGDGTGPAGTGSMTGRGLGFCSGNNMPGSMVFGPGCNRAFRKGGGRGMGRGLGFRNKAVYNQGFVNTNSGIFQSNQGINKSLNQKEILEKQLEILKQQTANIQEKLESLDD